MSKLKRRTFKCSELKEAESFKEQTDGVLIKYNFNDNNSHTVYYVEMALVVYDMDGTLNDLNGTICKEHNIDVSLLKNYKVEKNEDLTKEQVGHLIHGFHDVEMFKKASLLKEAYELKDIMELGCKVTINSLSFTQDIADFKRKLLYDELGISDLRLPVGSEKPHLDNTFILVEDSMRALENSKAEFNILIRKTYNENEPIPEVKNFMYVDNLKQANRVVKALVKAFNDEV